MATHVHYHLPSLQPDVNDGKAIFRGLPYAMVEKRWTHSCTNYDLEWPFDATERGPRCSPNKVEVLVTRGVNDPTLRDDESKCLNLNIAVPEDELKLAQSFRVWFGVMDGNPVILVQIQYSLGPLGCAASNDLKAEQAQQNEQQSGTFKCSLFGNYGLFDQINALEWVRDHISDFNGDPNNVTAFSVSAGSAIIHNHILTGNPLFGRAILLPGSAPKTAPLHFTLNEQAWQNFIAKASPDAVSLTPKEHLEQLCALSHKAVLENYTSAAISPLDHGALLFSNWQYTKKQAPTCCKSIIIGDTHVEGIIMGRLIWSVLQDVLKNIVRSVVADIAGYLRAFSFAESMRVTAYCDAMRTWCPAGMFQYPQVLLANTFPGAVYYCHFDEPSPYLRLTFGLSYYGQCALFTYLNHTDEYPDGARQSAQNTGHILTAFGS